MGLLDHVKMKTILGIRSGNVQFSMNCLKVNRPSVSFFKDVLCENWLWHIIEKWGFFLLDFVTKYLVDIFSEHPKSLFTIKFRNCSICDEQIYGIIGQLGRSSFMEMLSFLLHLQGDLFNCRLHHHKNHKNL